MAFLIALGLYSATLSFLSKATSLQIFLSSCRHGYPQPRLPVSQYLNLKTQAQISNGPIDLQSKLICTSDIFFSRAMSFSRQARPLSSSNSFRLRRINQSISSSLGLESRPNRHPKQFLAFKLIQNPTYLNLASALKRNLHLFHVADSSSFSFKSHRISSTRHPYQFQQPSRRPWHSN